MAISGPIPAGSPDVSARGFCHQRSTVFDHRGLADVRQIGLRFRLVFLQRTSCRGFPASSACRSWSACVSHNATISTPCLVISGGVRWPIGVLSSKSRSGPGMSAEVLVTMSRIAAFCIVLEIGVGLVAGLDALAHGSASFLRSSIAEGADPRGTISTIGCSLYSKASIWVVLAAFLGRGVDVFFADLQAFLEAAAHQAAPDHFGLEARLQRIGPNALALQRLGQLIGRDPHPLGHARIGLVDIAGGRVDAEPLGFLDLHLFIDQFVDHFLFGHLLVRGQEVQLGALLDVVVGDGLAVDQNRHRLRMQGRNAGSQQAERHGTEGDQRPEAMTGMPMMGKLWGRHGHVSRINQFDFSNATVLSGKVRHALLKTAAAGR